MAEMPEFTNRTLILMQGGSPLKDIASLKRAIRDDIIPLLEEYCYEDYGTHRQHSREQIVDLASQRIRQELFDDGQEMRLCRDYLLRLLT